ncbi:MAG: amidohydrolase family protein [Planctomycetota bacterium]|nr:amidohydrolase family protein [Planctomycetota bacterium]MDA1211215.1 amidohydrolase family protein [Planctomycetota bacterium]
MSQNGRDVHRILFFLIFASCAAPSLADDAPLAITNVTLFDSASAKMLDGRTIVIEGERIAAIGTPEAPISIPDTARIIDGDGKFAIPGLIDAHVHVVHLAKFMHVTGDEFLPMFLAAGVTSVRSTGDPVIAQAGVAHYAEANPQTCPRVFMASPLIDRDPPIHGDVAYVLTDPAAAPAFVADMVKWKVRTLKIYAGTGRAVGKAVIEAGHKQGLKVTAHLSAYSAQDAAEDGIDSLEHIESVFYFAIPAGDATPREDLDLQNPKCTALINLLANKKVAIDPTLVVFRNMIYLNDMPEYYDHPDVALCPERMRNYWTDYSTNSLAKTPDTQMSRRKLIAKYQELAGLLHRLGVTILVGTDAPEPFVPPGFSMHQELEMLVDGGISPADALQAATANNATILGEEKNLGSLEAGKLADVVLLTADPTKEIANTRKIELVIRGGIVCDPATVMEAVPKK